MKDAQLYNFKDKVFKSIKIIFFFIGIPSTSTPMSARKRTSPIPTI